MSGVVPIGYLTFREAAAKIEVAMFAGTPDRAAVVKARERYGGDVGDGAASQKAVNELWAAVDAERVRPVAVGGVPRRVVKLNPALTSAIPYLRRTGGFTFLRPRNPRYQDITGWFG